MALLWVHVVVVPAYGALRGYVGLHMLGHAFPLVVLAAAATYSGWSRRMRGISVALGLLTASAVAVHASHGLTEAHFLFFVVIIVLTLYEDWLVFVIAVAFVVLHHGVMGVFDPKGVYDHGGSPWMWAGIHGAFVLAAGVGAIATWRFNEDVRVQAGEVEERFRSAFDEAAIGMALTGLDGRWLQVNRALCELTGYTEAELLEITFGALTHPDDLSSDVDAMRRLIAGEMRSYATEKRYLTAHGEIVWVSLNISTVQGPDGPAYFVAQMQDITERRNAQAELAHQAMHDALTGLPNRALFMDRLKVAISQLDRRLFPLAVMFVDLDRFKLVNDSLGHLAGDELLKLTAERLRSALRAGDTVARIAGDEFTILCEDLVNEAEAIALADRLVDSLSAPFVVAGQEIHVSASMGLALVRGGRHDADSIVAQADAAMYRAKERGGSRFERFEEGMQPQVATRFELENSLRMAIDRDELRLHYQTEVSLDTSEVIGLEALVRWQHPTRGLVAPDEFIPLAEETGLIVPLGTWVLREACSQMASWVGEGVFGPEVRMAVNVSANQLAEPDMTKIVERTLCETGLSPRQLCIEVTETALMDGDGRAIETLGRLKMLGIQLAIDDFGTGFSSLTRIKELPEIDLVKIDRSFVSGLGISSHDAAIVSSVLNLAQSLGVPAIAEGVETDDQVERLLDLGCPLGQGYLFSRPSWPADVAAQRAMIAAPEA